MAPSIFQIPAREKKDSPLLKEEFGKPHIASKVYLAIKKLHKHHIPCSVESFTKKFSKKIFGQEKFFPVSNMTLKFVVNQEIFRSQKIPWGNLVLINYKLS